MLGLDLRNLWLTEPPVLPDASNPVLPATRAPGDLPSAPTAPPSPVTTPNERLGQPMTIELQADGVLMARGAITPGSASALKEELDTRGSYVTRVSLDSPGGLVREALEMARTLREAELETHVGEGAYCASSCPLILSGGTTRIVHRKGVVGVHQIYTPPEAERSLIRSPLSSNVRDTERNTQTATATITRHLRDMGVSTALWVHALETPPEALYYLTPEELSEYELATALEGTDG